MRWQFRRSATVAEGGVSCHVTGLVSGRVSGRVIGRKIRNALNLLVGAAGFEPATPSSRTRCATRLRYAPMKARAL